jgi:hypothetical protein
VDEVKHVWKGVCATKESSAPKKMVGTDFLDGARRLSRVKHD